MKHILWKFRRKLAVILLVSLVMKVGMPMNITGYAKSTGTSVATGSDATSSDATTSDAVASDSDMDPWDYDTDLIDDLTPTEPVTGTEMMPMSLFARPFAKPEVPRGKALLFYSSHTNIDKDTGLDSENMSAALSQLNEFKDGDIQTIELDAEDHASKGEMLFYMDEAFSENTEDSLSLIMYSGHGNNNPDGSASFAIGETEDEYLTAAELRRALNQYEGTFVIISSACFSGGMLRSAVRSDETDEADKFAKNFLKEFKAAGNRTRSGYDSSRFKLFMTAQSSEVGWGFGEPYGSAFIYYMQAALGYDSVNSDYNNYAADLDGDYCITVRELQNYLSKQYMVSTPVFFPENDNTVLFSYNEGTPAYFDAKLDSRLVYGTSVIQDGVRGVEAEVPVEVTAYAAWAGKRKLGLQTELLDIDRMGDIFDKMSVDEYDYHVTMDEDEIIANIPVFVPNTELNKLWGLRIGCDENLGASQMLSFSVRSNGESFDDNMPDYLKILEPYTAYDFGEREVPEDIQMVYQTDENGTPLSMPVTVRFDQEPTTRYGVAACRLTMRIYQIADDEGNLVEAEKPFTTLYEDLRPQYIIDSRLSEDPEKSVMNDSHYTCFWNFKNSDGELCDPGYYCFQVDAEYDQMDGGEEPVRNMQSVCIYIGDEGDAPTVISEWNSLFELTPSGGIDLRTITDNGFEDLTCDSNLSGQIRQSIIGWSYDSAEEIETEIPEEEWENVTLEQGKTYLIRMQASITDDFDLVFSPNCRVYNKNHAIFSGKTATDGKTMTWQVVCHMAEFDAEKDVVISGDLVAGSRIAVSAAEDERQLTLFTACYEKQEKEWVDLEQASDGTYLLPDFPCRICFIFEVKGAYLSGFYSCAYDVLPKTPDPEPKPDPAPTPGSTDHDSDDDSNHASDGVVNQITSDHANWDTVTASDGKILWKYRIPGGEYAVNCWQYLSWSGVWGWYRFDENGYMLTGWYTDSDGKRYYLNPKSDGTQGMWQENA